MIDRGTVQNTLPETNSSPLKIKGWKMKNPFAIAHFQGAICSFWGGYPFETVFSGDSRFPPTQKTPRFHSFKNCHPD